MTTGTGILDIPCLGRPFQLGTLYDYRSDCLVPSVVSVMLQRAAHQRPQTKSSFELISEDNLPSKTCHLGIQENMKLSVLMGLVNKSGSAKYLDDRKSSNKLQARVTLKYSCTTRFEELAVDKLSTIHNPTVNKKATHIVTGVLYGAEAFFVFDQEVAPGDYQTAHEKMKKVTESLPDTVTVEEMAEVQCKVYSDFPLPENPTSIQDAAKLLKKLPKLAESSSRETAMQVRLYPLNKLPGSVVKVPHEISPALVTDAEVFVETVYQLEMQCNDLVKTKVAFNFPVIQKQLSCFKGMINAYKSNMIKQLATLIPLVRGGDTQEADMTQIFRANEVSPFSLQRLCSWLKKKERAVTMLAGYLNNMKEIDFVTSQCDLETIVHNFEYEFVLCFAFPVTDEDDYLQCLAGYLQAPQVKQNFDDVLPKQWHEDKTIVADMRSQARQFVDFFKANKAQQRTKFIVSSCVKLENSDNNGAMIVLFNPLGTPEKFLPPTQPGKPTPTELVTNDSIQLVWGSPRSGAESVQSYTISYCKESDKTKQWKVERTPCPENTFVITKLVPKTKYCFKIHAQCDVGISPESDISDPIETSPNYALVVDEMHLSDESFTYSPISNSKPLKSRPGKPTASKITSNTVHLNWATPESDPQNIEFYSVSYRRMDQPTDWQTVKTQSAQEFAKVSGLEAKAVYCFKVRAEYEVGTSLDSEVSDSIETSRALPGKPGKPTAIKVTHNSIQLTWPGPEFELERNEFYSVLYRPMDNPLAQWQIKSTTGTKGAVILNGLKEKTVYCIKVRAECETGTSPDSEMSDPIETSPLPLPGRPGKPTASKVTHNSIHLNWPGPKSGIDGVKFYSVLYRRMDDASAQWQTSKIQDSQKEVQVSGLAAKTVYCFKFRAESEAGVNTDSEMSDPIATSPPPVPGKPGTPTATKVTHNSVHISWSSPTSGIEGIKFYSVIYRRMDDPSAQWQTTKTMGPQNEVTVSDLAAKAVYCFKVCAECEATVSSNSELSEPIATKSPPLPGKPDAPTASEVTHNAVHLSWSDHISGIQSVKFFSVSYRRMDDLSKEWRTTQTSDSQTKFTVSGLVAKASYCFRVCAVSEAGVGPKSDMSDPIITLETPAPGTPDKPTASQVTHNSIHLNWSGPISGIEGVKFFSVIYRRMDDSLAQWQTKKTQGSQKEVTVSGLAAKAVYCFKVRAESEASASPDSELSDPITTRLPPAPGKPGTPTASKITHNSVHLNWSGPTSGIEGVKFYSVVYRRMDDPLAAQWQSIKTQDSQNEVTVSGLAAKAVYCFKVRAKCETTVSPDSDFSDPIQTCPPPLPGQPGTPTASEVTQNSIHINWSNPTSGIEGVKSFLVTYRRMDDPSAQWQAKRTHASQNEVTLTGLTSKAVYCFKVRAECEGGVSPDSEMCDPIQTKPPPLPGKPGKPIATKVTHNSIYLRWPGSESFTRDIRCYQVSFCQANDPSPLWQTLKTQDAKEHIVVNELEAETVYFFKVCTECESGFSADSEISEIETMPVPKPSCPGKPNAVEVTHNTIDLNWSHPQDGADNVKYYTVSYCKSNGSPQHWEEKQTDGAAVRLTVSNLAARTKYRFKVLAESEAGPSCWSEVSHAIETHSQPLPNPPSKPCSSSVSHDTVVLNWSRPDCGAEDVRYYTVSYSAVEDHGFPDKWKTKKTAGLQERVTVTGLKPRATYLFKIQAVSDAGSSLYSESSDPIQLCAPPPPGQPGKPTASDNDIIHNSIILNWAKPKQGDDYVMHYTILYRRIDDPEDQWQTKQSDGARTTLTVSGLDPKTVYSFKVNAVGENSVSKDSEINVFHTTAKVRLAENMLSSAKMIEKGPPKIHRLKLKEVISDKDKKLKRCDIGKPDQFTSTEEKVILVLGATGAGKTTLINGMVNYLLGVEWGDEFRFKLIVDEGDKKASSDTAQSVSQTKWITAYRFHHQKGSPLPYTLTIIDTPGFGDTGGLERDHRITAQIKELFSMQPPNCIDHLNAIGFVTHSSLSRLTVTQKYIFDSILAIFGKDIASNIFMMTTFADGGDPPVLASIRAADIPFCDYFKFNNSALYASPKDNLNLVSKKFWEMGIFSFESFFAHLKTLEPQSLRLTKQVLDERKHLEAIIQGLLPQIKTIMSTMDELQQEEKILEQLQLESSDLESKELTYTVKAVHQRKIDLKPGEYVTNCIKCNCTCHYPCIYPDDKSKWKCAAMNSRAAGEKAVCQVCPGRCEWQKHHNNQFRIEAYEKEEERTLDQLLKKLETVKGDKNAAKTAVDKIKQKVEDLQRKIFGMICEAQQILARLDEIALKPNPLTELDYIDLLIETEKTEGNPGFQKRLEYLQQARHHAELISHMKEGSDAPEWLKEAVQKARERMEEHKHSFQQDSQQTNELPLPTQP